MRKSMLVMAAVLMLGGLANAAGFVPGTVRDTFVGKWNLTVTPDEDARKAGEHEFTDVATFKGSQFTSTELKKKGFSSATYSEDTRMGGIGSFEAVQKSATDGSAKWTGTVSVDQMTGDLNWTKADKSIVHYTVRGTKQ